MNTFTYININTPSKTIFSDKFVHNYIISGDVLDENGNQVGVIDFTDLEELKKTDKDNPELPTQEIS